ncbi:DUF1232 domain-containing protein [Candidatus Gracilibacteria bacterium]|nr:DUF1232 domain-containing protein [Candidatus Gracilibacteria bacterium]
MLVVDRNNLQRAADDAQLTFALLLDKRVPLHTKAVPGLAVAYILSPIDLIPGFIPVLGQLDDLAVLILGVQAFKQLAPPEILAEHQRRLGITTAELSLAS